MYWTMLKRSKPRIEAMGWVKGWRRGAPQTTVGFEANGCGIRRMSVCEKWRIGKEEGVGARVWVGGLALFSIL
jgi:hypothetical protein